MPAGTAASRGPQSRETVGDPVVRERKPSAGRSGRCVVSGGRTWSGRWQSWCVGCEHKWQLDRLTVHDGKLGGEYTCATCGLFEWVPDGVEETAVYWPE